jgi:thiamine pyrophosphate-dependent acetolactate synthase large subunit-like protein
VRRSQKEHYGNRIIASELHNPDFVKLAEAFGAQGLRAQTPEELRWALRRGFDCPATARRRALMAQDDNTLRNCGRYRLRSSAVSVRVTRV